MAPRRADRRHRSSLSDQRLATSAEVTLRWNLLKNPWKSDHAVGRSFDDPRCIPPLPPPSGLIVNSSSNVVMMLGFPPSSFLSLTVSTCAGTHTNIDPEIGPCSLFLTCVPQGVPANKITLKPESQTVLYHQSVEISYP